MLPHVLHGLKKYQFSTVQLTKVLQETLELLKTNTLFDLSELLSVYIVLHQIQTTDFILKDDHIQGILTHCLKMEPLECLLLTSCSQIQTELYEKMEQCQTFDELKKIILWTDFMTPSEDVDVQVIIKCEAEKERTDLYSIFSSEVTEWVNFLRLDMHPPLKLKLNWILTLWAKCLALYSPPNQFGKVVKKRMDELAEWGIAREKLLLVGKVMLDKYTNLAGLKKNANEGSKLRSRSSSTSSDKFGKDEEHVFELPQSADVHASIDEVYIQMEQTVDRIEFKSEKGLLNDSRVSKGKQFGNLILSSNMIYWYIPIAGNSNRGEGIRISVHNITKFLSGKTRLYKSALPKVALLTSPKKKDKKVHPDDNLEDTMQEKMAFYLGIYTQNQVYRFYPFEMSEMERLLDCVIKVTAMQPCTEERFIKEILTNKLEESRQLALDYLLNDATHPWIDKAKDLEAAIQMLTDEISPQRVIDIERLFHSCRLESEVTKETIETLKRKWSGTRSDAVRLKILTLLDRLLDPIIMRKGDAIFDSTYQWLKHLQESLDAQRSPEELEMVSLLVKRAKLMERSTLTPLIRNQLRVTFDNWEEFQLLNRMIPIIGLLRRKDKPIMASNFEMNSQKSSAFSIAI